MSQIAFSSAPFGRPSSEDFRQVGTVVPQANGRVVIEWGPTDPNGVVPVNPGTILGIDPSGGYHASPAGAIGNGEQFLFDGNCLTIRPNISINDGSVLIPGAPTIGYVIAARAL